MAIDWLRMEVNNGERPENVRLAYEVDKDDIKVHLLESWEKWLFNVLFIFISFVIFDKICLFVSLISLSTSIDKNRIKIINVSYIK